MNSILRAQYGLFAALGKFDKASDEIAIASGSQRVGDAVGNPQNLNDMDREIAQQNLAKRQAAASMEVTRITNAMMAELLNVQAEGSLKSKP